MKNFLIIASGAGVVCILASLVTLGATAAADRHWGVALTCLGAFALILFLLLFGWEYADTFWEGK
jgi:hypothetical protein